MCILFTKLPVNKNIHNECLSVSYIWMWELDHKEGWARKNGCFWTVVLEKTPERHLNSKKIKPVNPKGNQPWIFIGRTDTLKLNLQSFGHLMQRTDSFKKTLMLGKIEVRRRRGWQRWLDSITDLTDMSWSKLWEIVKGREAWRAVVHGVAKSQTRLNNKNSYTNIFNVICSLLFLYPFSVSSELEKDYCHFPLI